MNTNTTPHARSKHRVQSANRLLGLAALAFAAGLPSLLLMLYGGVIADRVARRKLLLITQSAMMLLAFTLAALTALLAVGFAVLLAYAARLSSSHWPQWMNRIVGLGYSVPGSVIAVGVLIPVTRLDNWLAGWITSWSGINPGPRAEIYAKIRKAFAAAGIDERLVVNFEMSVRESFAHALIDLQRFRLFLIERRFEPRHLHLAGSL